MLRRPVIREDAINVFTDGSSFSNPRRGGVGIVVVTVDANGDEVLEEHALPGYRSATNNEMELKACILGLELASDHPKFPLLRRVSIFTDSQYVSENYSRAIFSWPKRQWRTANGAPVLHVDLWKALVRKIKAVNGKIEIRWVKGHAKSAHNKRADKLARASAKNPVHTPLTVQRVRRKITTKSIELGSVKMLGQTLAIRIITDHYLRKQRLYRYKYEVLDGGSQFSGNVDLIHSIHMLSAGHHYEVIVNEDAGNPMIVEVVRELPRENASVG